MKKQLLFVLPLALTLLAGCDKEDTRTEVVMWHNSNEITQAALDNFVTKFEEQNPDINVTLTKESGDYDAILDKTSKGLAAGEKGNWPDIFLGYPDSVSQLLPSGKVVELSQFINDPEIGLSQEDLDDYIPQYLEEGSKYQFPGTYSLPYAKSTEAMYYNKIILNMDLTGCANGISAPNNIITEEYLADLTWEELFGKLAPALIAKNDTLDSSKQFLKKTNNKYSILGWSSDDNAFITLCEQYGIPYTSIDEAGIGKPEFNTPAAKSMVKTFYEAKKNHYFLTKISNDDSYTNNIFVTKQTIFDIGSTGGVNHYDTQNIDIGVTYIPYHEGHERKVINQGPSLAILKNGTDLTRAKAAWKFYKFITGTYNNAYFAGETGYAPIRYSAFDEDIWLEHIKTEGKEARSLDLTKAIVAQYTSDTETSEGLFSSYVFNGSAACREEVKNMFGSIMKLGSWSDATVNNLFNTAENNAKLACF